MKEKTEKKDRASQIVTLFYTIKKENIDDKTFDLYRKWYLENEHNEEKIRAMYELFLAQGGDENDQAQLKEEWEKLIARRRSDQKKIRTQWRIVATRIAAVLIPLLLFVGGFSIYKSGQANEIKEFRTEQIAPAGAVQKMQLPDSTQVLVNSGSKVIVMQDKHQRIAELSGESYFKVAKDEKRPFVVKTEQMQIKVLGTEFNVSAYPDQNLTTVTLAQGRVELILNDGRKWTLEPNQEFLYDKENKIGQVSVITNNQTVKSSEWRDGNLICHLLTIPEILKSVERKYGFNIKIDPTVRFSNEKYIMEFKSKDSMDFILTWIQELEPNFNYSINGKSIDIKPL